MGKRLGRNPFQKPAPATPAAKEPTAKEARKQVSGDTVSLKLPPISRFLWIDLPAAAYLGLLRLVLKA